MTYQIYFEDLESELIVEYIDHFLVSKLRHEFIKIYRQLFGHNAPGQTFTNYLFESLNSEPLTPLLGAPLQGAIRKGVLRGY